ncbi:TPA: type I 3-dehydroquinate dehydratase [Candidatus Peregrinibacteria bacterium]|nr:type I 3-dehydroquinate dehydratase [Candidatus Peregrinibacteria bacterium]
MKICVPLKTGDIKELKNQMQEISENYSEKVSVIEIWLGEFFTESVIKNTTDVYAYADNLLTEIFEQRKNLNTYFSLLFTLKGEKEQGNFSGTVSDTKEISRKIITKISEYSKHSKHTSNNIKNNPDYLDLDYNFDDDNLYEFFEEIKRTRNAQAIKNTDFQLILSAHFFEGTPSFPSLKNRTQLMQNRGADIVKIAAMPHDEKDVLTIFRVAENFKRKDISYIAISMGNIGKISRVLTPLWGGKMMFASLSSDNASASGQMTIDELDSLFSIFAV